MHNKRSPSKHKTITFIQVTNSTGEISDAQAGYLAGLADSLAQQDDFAIQNYADAAVTSPDVQQLFKEEAVVALLKEDMDSPVESDVFNAEGTYFFALSEGQKEYAGVAFISWISNLFSGLRRKVKRIFCRVVGALDSEQFDLKQIIKDVLIVLIPALAATTGLIPVPLPIVVSLTALLLKHGVAKVCPA